MLVHVRSDVMSVETNCKELLPAQYQWYYQHKTSLEHPTRALRVLCCACAVMVATVQGDVLCDGLAASPDCTGSEGVLLPLPHSLGPSSLRVIELLKLTPGD